VTLKHDLAPSILYYINGEELAGCTKVNGTCIISHKEIKRVPLPNPLRVPYYIQGMMNLFYFPNEP